MLGRLISGMTLVLLTFSGAACSKKGLSSLSKVLVKSSGGGAQPTSSDLTPFSITHPIANPHISSEKALAVQGTCRSGSMIRTSGAFSQTTGCAGGHFLLELAAAADGDFETQFEQSDSSGKVTGSAALNWKRDSSLPPTPVIQSPASPAYTASSSLTLEGACVPGNRMELSGDHESSVECASGSFLFPVQKTADGVYSFSIRQKNPLGLSSGATDFIWFRDTQIPLPPALQNPTQNPSVSRGASLTLSGTCESGNVVSLRGAEVAETPCSGDAFTFQVIRELDGTFAFEIFQTDLAGNRSSPVAHSWRHDSTLPPSPKIASPSQPHLSNENAIILQGECETGALVMLTGSASLLSTCSSGMFQFELSPGADGTHSYSVTQSDAAGNVSDETLFVWTRDTLAPGAPQILSPSISPHLSATDSLDIKGSCESGAKVLLNGDASHSVTCAAQSFSFTVTKTSDGSYPFSVSQIDPAGNGSSSASLTWTRDSTVPAEPQILLPTIRNPVSNQNSLVVSGTCLTGATVELNGAASLSQACSNGTYAFTVQKGMDGTYPFSVRQLSVTGVPSTTVALSWTRDTVTPEAPVLAQPSGPEFISNSDSLLISGSCETGATVNLTGEATLSTTCASGAFSLVVNKSTDGTYSFLVGQKDLAGNESGLASAIWRRDATSPESLVIETPASNPFVSGNDQVLLSGSCEPTLRILIRDETTGDSSESLCSPTGTFQVGFEKTVDGNYPFRLLQKDEAGNLSPVTDFIWNRDTSIPQSPNLVPAYNPAHSNGNSLVVSASCDSGMGPLPAVIQISGDAEASEILNPPNALTADCVNGTAQFEIRKTLDGTYRFFFSQENPNTSFSSSPTEFVWIRDTVVPGKPVLVSPAVQPFVAPGSLIVSGTCEPLASVRIQGASQLEGQCGPDGHFSFLVEKTVDGTYDFTLDQKDAAGNTSPTAALRWVRDSNAVSPPVILSPASNPTLNTQDQISITGSCQSGYSISLSGAASGNVLCVNHSFTFVVAANSDGTRDYAITQSVHGVLSAPVTFQWIRDTQAPTLQITAAPPTTQIEKASQFFFSASEPNVSFRCKIDQGSFQTCTSPFNLGSATNGSHTFTVQATDLAGNTGPSVSRLWVQSSYNTLALYHFSGSAPLKDSSSYATLGNAYDQSLTSSVATSPSLDATGKLPNSAPSSLRQSSSALYSVPANQVINTLGRKTMTVEGFVKLSSLIGTSNHYYTLVSKSGSASPDFGWEIRLRRKSKSNTYELDFVGSLNGTSSGTVVSSNSFTISSTSTWNYFAVTWNQGTVSFYFGSSSATSRGSKTIGTVGSAVLSSTSAPLRIGFGPKSSTSGTSRYLAGVVDEIRISQMVRPTITLPLSEFSPD